MLEIEVSGGGEKRVLEGLAIRLRLGLPAIYFTILPTRSGVFFYGRGWGHGVGLCQQGAKAMAEAGYDAMEILRTYYPKLRPAHW